MTIIVERRDEKDKVYCVVIAHLGTSVRLHEGLHHDSNSRPNVSEGYEVTSEL